MSDMASFDALAPSYDVDFSQSIIGRHLRGQVQNRLMQIWQADDHILELGCGTGEDALFLSQQGIKVTATDASPKMLDITRHKTQSSGTVTTQLLDLNKLSNLDFANIKVDGVLSNFGALNCMEDWRPLTQWLSSRIKVGGIAGFAIMAPYCLWETLWHGIHLDFKTATRRWKSSTSFQADETSPAITIHYPNIQHITQDFSPYFQRIAIKPLGLFLPPSDIYPVIEKRPNLLKLLINLDSRFTKWGRLASFADHYWIEFKRL